MPACSCLAHHAAVHFRRYTELKALLELAVESGEAEPTQMPMLKYSDTAMAAYTHGHFSFPFPSFQCCMLVQASQWSYPTICPSACEMHHWQGI